MRHDLAGLGLPEPFFDLRDEAQALDGIFERGLLR
jgi:hypothetical protein